METQPANKYGPALIYEAGGFNKHPFNMEDNKSHQDQNSRQLETRLGWTLPRVQNRALRDTSFLTEFGLVWSSLMQLGG